MPLVSEISEESTGAAKTRAGWLSKAFSFPVMCMCLLSLVILKYAIRGIAEPDIWWVLRNARELLLFHSFPRVDSYSFSAAGSPWLDKEWLSGLVYYLAFRSAGLQGLLAAYFVVLVAIFTGVYYLSWRAGAGCKDAAVATLGAICLGGVSMAPRTLLFGWLCMVGLLLVVDTFRRTGKHLWLLPVIFALWINFHGSWVFGFVVLAATIASGLVEGQWGRVTATRWCRAELKALALAFIASIAALFVNPFGYRLVLYPFDLAVRQKAVMQYLDEWQPVDFGSRNGTLALLLVLGILAAALFSLRQWRLHQVLLAAFALWAALSHTRFLFFAGLILFPILAPQLTLFPPYQRDLEKPWLNAVLIAGILCATIWMFPSEASLDESVRAEYPHEALLFMQRHHLEGKIFNQYKFGGYMDWNAPELKPFIDGRADIFIYNGVFNDFINATSLKGTAAILQEHDIDYVLYEPNQPLTYFLEHSKGWRLLYADKVAVLFERDPGVPATVHGSGQSPQTW